MTAKWTADSISDLSGKYAVVTGANSGIGYEMARALAAKGATVVLACRNWAKGKEAVRRIRQVYSNAQVELMPLDLSDLASVRRFGEAFSSRFKRLDILINNAGVMAMDFRKTANGFELQIGTNHLGHFALVGQLLDLILKTPSARVVTVSSMGHHTGAIDFDNLNAERGFKQAGTYGQSKLANLLFTYELQRRFVAAGVDAMSAAAHPGMTATNLQIPWVFRVLTRLLGQRAEMGALPALYAATAADVAGGEYYGPDGWQGLKGYPSRTQSSDDSYDPDVAATLWAMSEELTGVRYRWPVV